jgi:phage shock protein PspC (stress-responsive transcriptional regulator)
MATIIILLGSILGFVGGLTAYFGFDASFWTAVSVWVAAGPASALLVILAATFAPQRPGFAPVLAKVA